MTCPPDYQKARKRTDILWNLHAKNGKVLRKDVENLFGQPHINIYITFAANNIEGPPIWDSQSEIVRRRAATLNSLASRLGQDYLARNQAALELSVKPSSLDKVLNQIDKYHYDIPKIEGHENITLEEKQNPIKHNIPRIDENYYPSGLQILDSRMLPDGKIIHRIR